MRCPLKKPEPNDNCVEEECAWWDKTREQCAMLTIATFLVLIKDYTRGICEDLGGKKK